MAASRAELRASQPVWGQLEGECIEVAMQHATNGWNITVLSFALLTKEGFNTIILPNSKTSSLRIVQIKQIKQHSPSSNLMLQFLHVEK